MERDSRVLGKSILAEGTVRTKAWRVGGSEAELGGPRLGSSGPGEL